jgi:hypothetical protein
MSGPDDTLTQHHNPERNQYMKTVRKKQVTDDRNGQSEEEDEKEEREAKRGEWKSKLKKPTTAEQVGDKC